MISESSISNLTQIIQIFKSDPDKCRIIIYFKIMRVREQVSSLLIHSPNGQNGAGWARTMPAASSESPMLEQESRSITPVHGNFFLSFNIFPDEKFYLFERKKENRARCFTLCRQG